MTDEITPTPENEAPISSGSDLYALLDQLVNTVRSAKSVPLSGNAILDRDQTVSMIERIRSELPDEMRAARWMIREREAFVARTNETAREIIDKARERSKELVSETHVIAEAVEEANILVRRAEGDARRIRLEAEDYADSRLEHLEILFANMLKQIREARAEFHQSRPRPPEPPISQ